MTTQGSHCVEVRQVIPAAAADVFDAWLDPGSLAVWMCPGDTTEVEVTTDPVVGGNFLISMHAAARTRHHRGVYQVIDRPNRLAFTWISDATSHGESLVTVVFNPRGGDTEVVLTHERLPSDQSARDHLAGWTRILVLLQEHLHNPVR